MKYLMLAVALVLQSATCAENGQSISVKELPTMAQTFIRTHFAGKQVSLVLKDRDGLRVNYDVMLSDGTKLEFDKKGGWTEIDCKPSAVPAALVPADIANYVKENHPDVRIVQIERYRRGYEIDLSNGLDIRFNKQMEVVEIDD